MNYLKDLSIYFFILGALLFNQLVFSDIRNPKKNLAQEKILQQETTQTAYIKAIIMRNMAEATDKMGSKVRYCKTKERTFQPNAEDKKYHKKYKTLFFTTLSLVNLRNSEQCYFAEQLQLEAQYKNTYRTLKYLSIFPQLQKSFQPFLGRELNYRKAKDKDYFNQLSHIPLELLFYIKKRTANQLYDQSAIFGLLQRL